MRRWINALVVAAVTAVIALLAAPAPSAIVVHSAQPLPAYAYDGHDRSALSTTSTSERGPPAAYDHFTSDDAVDSPSHGASARPDRTMTSPVIGYDRPVTFLQGARLTGTTGCHARVIDEEFLAVARTGVAAKSGTELRKVGSVLESVDDVMANPSLLKGRHPVLVENILKDTPGW